LKIIAFSGRKQSGKTTAANAIHKRTGAVIVNFADVLKEIVALCFTNVEHYQDLFTTDESKCRLLPCGRSARELMQLVGTDYFRSIDPYCWVRTYRRRIKQISMSLFNLALFDSAPVVVTGDVRFENEVECIQQLGGHVIRLTRCPFPDDKHESETALDKMETVSLSCPPVEIPHIFDAVVDNSDSSVEQQNDTIWDLITSRRWL